jgi:hypothetical protein
LIEASMRAVEVEEQEARGAEALGGERRAAATGAAPDAAASSGVARTGLDLTGLEPAARDGSGGGAPWILEASTRQPACVLFNPPAPAGNSTSPGPTNGALRWCVPSRIDATARALRAGGARVLVLDAVAQKLEEREARERILGMEATAVIYSAAEGGMDRIIASARRMRLLAPGLRRVLMHAGPVVASAPGVLFDAVFEGPLSGIGIV